MAESYTTKNITTVEEVNTLETTDKIFVNDSDSLKQISLSNLMDSSGAVKKNQGAENSGKSLIVSEDGNVVLGEEPVKVDSTLTKSGHAADAKATGDKISSLSEDINNLLYYDQTDQTIRVEGTAVSGGAFDTIKKGGYWDIDGTWREYSSYISYGFNPARADYELYIPKSIVLFICIFDGMPSKETFYKRMGSDYPSESSRLTIKKGQAVDFCTTDSTGFTVTANNLFVKKSGEFLDEKINEKIEESDIRFEGVEDYINIVNAAFPIVEKTNVLSISKNDMSFIGNKYPNTTGYLYDNSGYWAYTYIVPYDGELFISNIGNSSYGYLAIYNGSVSDGNLASDRITSRPSTPFFDPIKVLKGQIILLSVALAADSENNVSVTTNTTLTYDYTVRPTLFQRKKNVAWFGDSISQLQKLPHRVAEYLGIIINDCSFAGANLSIAGTTSHISLLELSKMIVSKDWTRLDDYLESQESGGIDVTEKKENANNLKKINFEEITDIICMIGTNDLNNDYVTTSSSLEVFKESMRTIICNINDAYPQINIYFISNPYRGDITPEKPDKYGHSLIDIIEAEKEICKEYNIPFYDLYHNSGINKNTVNYYLLKDLLHQNENGDILMAKKIAQWLNAN